MSSHSRLHIHRTQVSSLLAIQTQFSQASMSALRLAIEQHLNNKLGTASSAWATFPSSKNYLQKSKSKPTACNSTKIITNYANNGSLGLTQSTRCQSNTNISSLIGFPTPSTSHKSRPSTLRFYRTYSNEYRSFPNRLAKRLTSSSV